jgi:hypothetical protein
MARDWEVWLATASGPASPTEEQERDRTEKRIRDPITAVEGDYWMDRGTKGRVRFSREVVECASGEQLDHGRSEGLRDGSVNEDLWLQNAEEPLLAQWPGENGISGFWAARHVAREQDHDLVEEEQECFHPVASAEAPVRLRVVVGGLGQRCRT